MMEIGNKGLAEANLMINQNCSLNFTVIHKDSNGNVIDHSQSQGYIALKRGKNSHKFPYAVHCGESNIGVSISPDDTKGISPGDYDWDLIVSMQSGEVLRLIYGEATLTDTYALD